MNKSPAFSFYAKDWLDIRVLRMSYEAQGVYIRLLAHMWSDSPDQCSIQSDVAGLCRILGLSRAKLKRILGEIQHEDDPIFLKDGIRFVSKRLMLEKENQLKNSQKRSEAGQKGANGRWQTHDFAIPSAIGLPSEKNGLSSSSSTASSYPPVGPPPAVGGSAPTGNGGDDRRDAKDATAGTERDLAVCLEAAKPFKIPRDSTKAKAFEDLFRQGVEVPRIVAALDANPKAKFYAVVDLLSNGRAVAPFKAAAGPPKPDPADREKEFAKLEESDRARKEADKKLAELPPNELEAWRREVEEDAKTHSWAAFLNDSSMKTALRLRAAKKYGIGGL